MTTPIITIRPGPVLHVWANGAEFIAVPLTWQSALSLAADLILQARIMPAPNPKGIHPDWTNASDCLKCGQFRGHGHECKPAPHPDKLLEEALKFGDQIAIRGQQRGAGE